MAVDLRDAVFKGCTRPAMVLGVPLVPFVAIVGGFALAGSSGIVLVGPLAFPLSLAALAPVLIVLRTLTRRDDQRLHQIVLRLTMSQRGRALRRWRTRTYGPFPGRRD